MKRIKFLFILPFVISYLNAEPFIIVDDFIDESDEQLNIINAFDEFGNVVKMIFNNYIEDVSIDSLMKTSIEGMLSSLDPYSEYINDSKPNDLSIIADGKYFGYGFSLYEMNNKMVITTIRYNCPARRVGLKVGDVIISVNDTSFANEEDYDEFFSNFGAEDINLKVIRIGNDDTINITIAKDTIPIRAVTYSDIINENIGYIQLKRFTTKTYYEFLTAFFGMQNKKELKGLIIDLRGNTGGLLTETLKLCNIFIPKGSLMLTTRGKNRLQEYKALNDAFDTETPLIILIDEGSASASEVVAGCFQDLDRATIVGNTSYGKGLVQEVYKIGKNHNMKLTTSKYYTPSGRCIQKINHLKEKTRDTSHTFYTKKGKKVYDIAGITPDIIVERDTTKCPLAKMLKSAFVIFNFTTYYVNCVANADTNAIYDSFLVYTSDFNNIKNVKTIVELTSLKELNTNSKIVDIIDDAINAIFEEYKTILAENETTKEIIKRDLINSFIGRTSNYNDYTKYRMNFDEVIKTAVENFK